MKARIWTNKDIDIKKLESEIISSLGLKRWQDSIDKKGFSGITIITHPNWQELQLPSPIEIRLHFTEDGVVGRDADLQEVDIDKITKIIGTHKPSIITNSISIMAEDAKQLKNLKPRFNKQ